MNIKEMVEKLYKAKQSYYNSGTSIMSDEEFDALENELKSIDSCNEYFTKVGIGGEYGTKIKHQIPMLSLGKTKTTVEVMKWVKKLGHKDTSFIVQPKIDGLSATLKYKDGILQYIATRGDGIEGRDISHIAKYLDVPKKINCSNEIEVRGELYVPKDTKFKTEGKPLRNIACGLVNRKTISDDLIYVKFIAYKVESEYPINYLESGELIFLLANNFEVVPSFIFIKESTLEEIFKDYLSLYRNIWNYETDGLVVIVDDKNLHKKIDERWVVSHHHHYTIALKPPAQSKKTRLIDIEWNISKNGYYIPVALFEPVVIGNATLQRATLNNVENVIGLKLHKYDEIIVSRRNEVIPYIEENLSEHKEVDWILVPKTCNSCGAIFKKEGVHLRCNNPDCDEKTVKKTIDWCNKCGMDDFAQSTIRALFINNIINEITDLYKFINLNYEKLWIIEGFGEKKINNLLHQIKKSREVTEQDFLVRLGIENVGKKALQKLNINTVKDLINFTDETYSVGRDIINWCKSEKNMAQLLMLMDEMNFIIETINTGIHVAMTGSGPKGRKELVKDIEAKGDCFDSSVSKSTDLLICEDINGTSSKLVKAKKAGVELISYADYFGV